MKSIIFYISLESCKILHVFHMYFTYDFNILHFHRVMYNRSESFSPQKKESCIAGEMSDETLFAQ